MKKAIIGLLSLAIVILLSSSGGIAGEKKDVSKTDVKDSLVIDWYKYDKGLEKAKSDNKYIMLFFRTRFCKWCNLMERTSFADREVIRRLRDDFTCIKIDLDVNDKVMELGGNKISNRDVAGMFGVLAYPYFVFLDPDQNNIGVLPGYIEKSNFVLVLEYIADHHYKKEKFGEFLKRKKGKTKEK